MLAAFIELANLGGQLQAVHFRHQPVGEQHMGRSLVERRECFTGAAGVADVAIAGLLEYAADQRAGEPGIVHHHDAEVGIGHGCGLAG
ncbi:hypothetical protein D3C80_1309830 [compost metagenome]